MSSDSRHCLSDCGEKIPEQNCAANSPGIEIAMNPDENATASHEGNPAMLVRPRSSRVRLSGIEAMVNAIDGRASVRAEYRKSVRMSHRSLSSISLSVPNHLDAAEDEDDDAAPSEDEKTMTVWSGALVLSQSMLGGGLYVLAYGAAQFGLVLAVVFMAISCSLTLLSLNVLAMLALDFKALSPRERLSFASVSCMILPRFGWVLDASVLILCGGAMIAYLSNSSNFFAQGLYSMFQWDLASLSLRSTSFVCAAVILVCILPLSLNRQMGSTKIASIFGLSCIFYIVFMTMFYSPCTVAKTDFAKLIRPAGIFQIFATFPVFVFCYGCQFSVFHIVNELQHANRTRLNLVFVTALVTCSSIYAVSMLLPFFTFGADVKQSFLQSIRRPDGSQEIPLIVAFVFAALALSVSYALLQLPVRVSIMTFVFGNEQPDGSREVRWRVFITICILLVSFGCSAALGDNLSLPIEIAGLLGGNTLAFVFPFTMYLKHYGLKNDKPLLSLVVLVSLVFCCLLYPICLVGIFSPSNF